MYKRARIAVEVDTFFGIEKHVFASIDFKDKVFKRTHAHDTGNLVALVFSHIGKLTQLFAGATSGRNHLFHQVVGVYHGTFATLHLAIGQFNHTVREVHQFFSPFESEPV